MGYVEFETEKARYRLELSTHGGGDFHPKDMIQADAFVLELAQPEHTAKDMEENRGIRSAALSYASRNEIKVFFPDAMPTETSMRTSMGKEVIRSALPTLTAFFTARALAGLKTRRRWIKEVSAVTAGLLTLGALEGLPFTLPGKGKIEKRNMIRWEQAKWEQIWPTAKIELRNALTAEKCESFIAPRLQRQLGRKPVIYMLFGASHAGLQENLQNPTHRRKILRAFYPLEKYFEPQNLHNVIEAKWNKQEGKWKVERHKNILKETPTQPATQGRMHRAPKTQYAAKREEPKKYNRRQLFAALRRKPV